MNVFRLSIFIIFGIVLQQLVHHLVEMLYIDLLISDFQKYSLGLRWEDWFIIHHVASFVLLAAGAWFGYMIGKKLIK